MFPAFRPFTLGEQTATGGTAFLAIIPGNGDRRVSVTSLRYNSPSVQHSIYFLGAKAKTTVATAAISGATTLVLASDPGAWGSAKATAADPLATNNNQYISYRQADGTWGYNKVTATTVTNGQASCTVSALGTAISVGTVVYLHGTNTDTDPNTGLAFPLVRPPISAITTIGSGEDAIYSSSVIGAPVLIYVNNTTLQGYLENIEGCYSW